jgi:uncharacterized membrane protein YfcA
MITPLEYGLLFCTGFAAGVVNILAGGGSFLTLPVLIFVGLPAGVANATNRLAIVFQNLGAAWGFQRKSVIPWDYFAVGLLPACLGSLVGVWAALEISDVAFQRLLAFFMVAISLWTLWDPIKNKATNPKQTSGRFSWTNHVVMPLAFFGVGVYGGFVQAGVGFLVLALTTATGLDLVRGNAIKIVWILVFTIFSLSVFLWQGWVVWVPGLVLGAGNTVGGLLGVHLTVLKGHSWVKRVVTVAVIVFAVKLWFSG